MATVKPFGARNERQYAMTPQRLFGAIALLFLIWLVLGLGVSLYDRHPLIEFYQMQRVHEHP